MFARVARVRHDVQEILTIVRLHLSEGEAESLVGWMAHRVGRAPSLAGAGDPLQRLEHVVTHWLDDAQRTGLRAWLARRIALGERPVPP